MAGAAARSAARQVAVARTEREAVLGAHRRRADDLDRQVQVVDHAPDHRELLEILLAEDRDVRLHQAQQLDDHGRDALEMPGPERAAEDVGEAGHVDRRCCRRCPPGTSLRPSGGTARRRRTRAAGWRRRPGVRGYALKSSDGPNCIGLTKMLEITRRPCRCAADIRLACPMCRLPMVGTNAMLSRASRQRVTVSRSSAIRVIVCIGRAVPACVRCGVRNSARAPDRPGS